MADNIGAMDDCVTCGAAVPDADQLECRVCDADPLCPDCFDTHDCDPDDDEEDE